MLSWREALDTLAATTRARIGQLTMLDRHEGMVLNILSGTSADEEDAWIASGGPDPRINPRTRAALNGRSLQCQIDDEFTTPRERAGNAIYRGLFAQADVPHACITRLDSPGDLHIALSLLRPGSSGAATAEERALIEALAPALRGLIECSLRLGTAHDATLLRTVEHLAAPALLLGCDMAVLSTTPASDALLAAGTHLTVRNGRLAAHGKAASDALDRAFRAVTRSSLPEHATVSIVLPSSTGAAPLAVELCGLPARAEGPLSLACAVLTVRVPRAGGASHQLLQESFGFTPRRSGGGGSAGRGTQRAAGRGATRLRGRDRAHASEVAARED